MIGWGIIGLGRIAQKFAADLRFVPDARLQAVASRSADNARQFAETFGAARAYGSYAELLADPDVDVVYIANPHTDHHASTLLALRHRKPVLCEKPFAINRAQVQEMVDLARQNGVFLMEALWTRFLPSTIKVLEWINSGAIGEVRTVTADFGFRTPIDPQGRLFNKALGGGALLDIGIYPLYLATLLLGQPAAIKAHATFAQTGVDEQIGMIFSYEGGAVANLSASVVSDTPTEAHIAGSRGRIKMGQRWFAPVEVELWADDREPERWSSPEEGFGYRYEAAEVGRCLHEGRLESPGMTWAHSLQLMDLLDQVRGLTGIRYQEDGF